MMYNNGTNGLNAAVNGTNLNDIDLNGVGLTSGANFNGIGPSDQLGMTTMYGQPSGGVMYGTTQDALHMQKDQEYQRFMYEQKIHQQESMGQRQYVAPPAHMGQQMQAPYTLVSQIRDINHPLQQYMAPNNYYNRPGSPTYSERSRSPSPLPPRIYKPCVVCQDKSSGYHYGVSSCEGCKGFFRRSVQKNMQYTCHKERNCLINKVTRNRCQYCRLQKCFISGMSKEAVRNDRNKKRKSSAKQEPCGSTSEQTEPGLSAEEQVLIENLLGAHQSTFATVAGEEDDSCLKNDAKKDKEDTPGTSTEGTIGLVLWDRLSELSSAGIIRIVDFAKKIPGFQDVPTSDQITLLKAACLEIMILRLCSKYRVSDDSLVSQQNESVSRNELREGGFGNLADTIFNFAASLKSMEVDDSENALLAAVCLISGDRSGLEMPEKIEKLQEPLLEALKHYVRSRRQGQQHIFAKLLMKLTDLRSISVKGEGGVFSLTIKTIERQTDNIVHDYDKRRATKQNGDKHPIPTSTWHKNGKKRILSDSGLLSEAETFHQASRTSDLGFHDDRISSSVKADESQPSGIVMNSFQVINGGNEFQSLNYSQYSKTQQRLEESRTMRNLEQVQMAGSLAGYPPPDSSMDIKLIPLHKTKSESRLNDAVGGSPESSKMSYLITDEVHSLQRTKKFNTKNVPFLELLQEGSGDEADIPVIHQLASFSEHLLTHSKSEILDISGVKEELFTDLDSDNLANSFGAKFIDEPLPASPQILDELDRKLLENADTPSPVDLENISGRDLEKICKLAYQSSKDYKHVKATTIFNETPSTTSSESSEDSAPQPDLQNACKPQ